MAKTVRYLSRCVVFFPLLMFMTASGQSPDHQIGREVAIPVHLQDFFKSLQVLPPGSKSLVIDEHGNPKDWPPSGDPSQREL